MANNKKRFGYPTAAVFFSSIALGLQFGTKAGFAVFGIYLFIVWLFPSEPAVIISPDEDEDENALVPQKPACPVCDGHGFLKQWQQETDKAKLVDCPRCKGTGKRDNEPRDPLIADGNLVA